MPCTNCNIAGHNKRTCPWKKCEICQELFANTENSKIIEDKDGMKLACFKCWKKIEEKQKEEEEEEKCEDCGESEKLIVVQLPQKNMKTTKICYSCMQKYKTPEPPMGKLYRLIGDNWVEVKERFRSDTDEEIEYLINGGDWCDSD